MTPAERQDREASAERALKRGDLAQALGHLRAILDAAPDDASLAQRVAALAQSLSPQERSRAVLTPAAPAAPAPPASPIHAAEELAARGDIAGAIAQYRALLAEQPHNELLTERLSELFRLAQVQAPRHAAPVATTEAVLSDLLTRIGSRRRG